MQKLAGRSCQVCGKRPAYGRSVTRRGLAKKKGGVGRKITGRAKRKFLPNIQKVRVKVGGKVVRLKVCTACLRQGRVNKAAS